MAFNILVADDSATMRMVIKKMVRMTGLPIGDFAEAANGREALAVLESSWIDVLLTDVNMPEMGGMELLRAVKSDDVHRNIPVIFISTESSECRMTEAKSLGAAAYIKKPFVPEKIKEILSAVLAQAYASRLAAETAAAGAEVEAGEEECDF